MSVSKIVQDAINQQVNAELSASYQYLAMAAYCERQHLRGIARWMRLQSQEEYGHGMKLFDFLIARGCEVELKQQEVSAAIDSLYDLAFREKAFSATVELQWFLTEQVEEEQSAREILAKLQMVKDDPASLLDLDRELGSRAPGAK